MTLFAQRTRSLISQTCWMQFTTAVIRPAACIRRRRFSSLVPIAASSDARRELSMTPDEIVAHLDKNVIGQTDAKKAVAMAMRNRWRRQQLTPRLQSEVLPMNILMIGSTGTGKTEIARRLAKLSESPFVKAELTRFTETGIYGADVFDVIKDLVDEGIRIQTEAARVRIRPRASAAAEQVLLDQLRKHDDFSAVSDDELKRLLRDGHLNDREMELHLPAEKNRGGRGGGMRLMFGPMSGASRGGMPDFNNMLSSIREAMSEGRGGDDRHRKTKTTIGDAMTVLVNAEADKLLDEPAIHKAALHSAEQFGIVFLDEIDKLAHSVNYSKGGSKGEGVQKELLSMLEGTVVQTQYGPVNTQHVLFICAGAFHSSKPSDLMAELQGRLPIRVKLNALTRDDFHRILTEKEMNLIEQQEALLKTERVQLEFSDDAIHEIAVMAAELNNRVEDIGARRLNTIVARVVADVSYSAATLSKAAEEFAKTSTAATATPTDIAAPLHKEKIDAAYVRAKVSPLLETADLKKFVL